MAADLGDRAKDKISGFIGIVTAHTRYLESCDQVFLRPEKLDEKGALQKGEWFDSPWVEVIKVGVFKPTAVVQTASGTRLSGGPNRPHSR